ncbi:MAG TPA: DUF1836 domain-containing protein [Bacillota bacterium]|nr:DUF1836 domain-containing protein [Bacillota bacterium]
MALTKILPGTTIEVSIDSPDVSDKVFSNIFMTGGLVLSQVSMLTNLEPYTVQNWVKRGFLSPPVNKMYTRRQFCRIVIINMLKDSLQLDRITELLSYINGVLSDESDDLINDSDLYDYYIALLYWLGDNRVEESKLNESVQKVIADYKEPFPGAGKRLEKVLKVITVAHLASQLRQKADRLMNELK